MGIKEVLTNTFIRLRQNLVQEALIYENDAIIPIDWVERDGRLVAFFPADKSDFSRSVEGSDTRTLANAYVLGFVNQGDELLVGYIHQPEFIEMTYVQYKGTLGWLRRFGDQSLHVLRPVGELKPGITYGGEITYWEKANT